MKRRKNRNVFRMLPLISQLGICMLTCIFICVFLGSFLARELHQELLFPLMLVLGILAGMRSCYKMIQVFYKEKESLPASPDKAFPYPLGRHMHTGNLLSGHGIIVGCRDHRI